MVTVFHSGELALQTQSRVDQRAHKMGNALIRDHIIDQHKEFFENLPYVFLALHDKQGRPWLSVMQGVPGFITSPEPKILKLKGEVIARHDLGLDIGANKSVGVVGLDLSTRRRNRLNGKFDGGHAASISINVEHSFGNCPKYIQQRYLDTNEDAPQSDHSSPNLKHRFAKFSQADIELVEESDTLFIASSKEIGGDLDASHRGGKPGFVRVVNDKQLWFKDYPGNNFFQTFGNIHRHPNIGLTFIDFNNGDLLLLCGKARLVKGEFVESSTKNDQNPFLERRLHFTLTQGLRVKAAIKGRWSSAEMSPFLGDDLN